MHPKGQGKASSSDVSALKAHTVYSATTKPEGEGGDLYGALFWRRIDSTLPNPRPSLG